MSIITDYKDCTPPDLFRTQKINASVSLGTHMDAPAHVIPGGRTIDKLTLEELVVDCVVIDVSQEANENYFVMPSAIEKFEKGHGKIPEHSLVIFYTGWSKYWENSEKYHNKFGFPSVDLSTAEILLQRKVVGLGIDTFSCDTGKKGFPVHRAILGADKYLVENVANANLLPAIGSKVLVLPIKKRKAEARADSSPRPRSFARASASLRLISPQKISGGVRIAFSPHFPFWKALCLAQRRVARGETLVL